MRILVIGFVGCAGTFAASILSNNRSGKAYLEGAGVFGMKRFGGRRWRIRSENDSDV